jgi:hypothetical protein
VSLPYLLQQVMQNPGMFFSPVEFDVASAFIQGVNLSSSGGVLVGFREALITKLGYGNNLIWSELALRLIFPGDECPRLRLVEGGNQKRAVQLLFELLEDFWRERESPQGLRTIYLKYQTWLKHQDWYGPSSPDYVAEVYRD